MILMLPLIFILPDQSDAVVDSVFLGAVFAFWSWVGFQFRRNAAATMPLRRATKIAYLIGFLLASAVGLVVLKNLMVSRILKILVVAFGSSLALIWFLRSAIHQRGIDQSAESQPVDQ